MKTIYCANCGSRLTIYRKALPKYGRIIDLVEPHVCLAEPVEFDLTPVDVPTFANMAEEGEENKFVQNLNELQRHPSPIGTDDLKDRRKTENIKSESSSTAPRTLLDSIKILDNSTPANDIKDEPREE